MSVVPYTPGERPSTKETFQACWRLVKIGYRTDRSAFIVMVVSTVLDAPVYALVIYATAQIVNALTVLRMNDAWFWIAVLMGSWIFRNISHSIHVNRLDLVRQKLTVELQDRYLTHLTKLPYIVLEDPNYLALAAFVAEKRGQVGFVFEAGFDILQDLASLLGLATIVFFIPWPVSVIMVLTMILRFISHKKLANLQWAILNMNSREGRRAIYYRGIIEQPAELERAKGIGITDRFMKQWRQITRRLLEKRLHERMHNSMWAFISFQFDNLGLGVGMVLLAKGIVDGTSPLSAFVVFLSNYQRLTPQMRDLSHATSRFLIDAPVVPLIFRIFDIPAESEKGKNIPKESLAIRFENVSFRYPGAEKDVLRDVSFEFLEGDHIALVGLNGAGKTTMLKLLKGVYEPTSGRITVNGTSLSDIKPSSLRRVLAIMSQEPPRYSDSIVEQVHYGDYDRPIDDQRLKNAIKASGLKEVVSEMPNGIDTIIGKMYAMPEDKAIELSGGQNQIVAIARTLYRDARVYVFDEPTSAVDAEKEESFFSRLPDTLAGKAIIFVSHRFSTLRRAKRILVLEDGRLIEDGSHEELIELKGRYAELFTLQAKNYQ